MMTEDTRLKEIRAALEREPRVRLHQNRIHLESRDGAIILEGAVDSVAAKKLALELAAAAGVGSVEDRLSVASAEPRPDGAIRVALTEALLQEPTLRNFAIRVWQKGQEETVRQAPPESGGVIGIQVENGAVTLSGQALSLSHMRLAGALAWWTPGVTNVINLIKVAPPQKDTDAELNDAICQVLEKDHLLPTGQIAPSTRNGIVTLQGLVFRDTEKKRAEHDAWCVLGVRDVVNNLEVQR